ncbi:MAG TPA: OmpA family protein [Candidatus Methylomirabilis sp.]|nr:OmpA family protein [Candidatus Methylomirabilis sp.]
MADVHGGAIHHASDGGVAGKHLLVQDQGALVAPATEGEHNTIKAGIIPIACWRVEDIRFAFDSSVVRPEIEVELKHLAALLKEHPPPSRTQPNPGSPLSVFGHADPVGNDDYNKLLSGRRGMAIYALLTRRTDLWEKLYSQPLGNDKWGARALQMMLDTVSPPPSSGEPDPNRAAPHERSAGKRGELFAAYMAKLCGPDLELKKQDFLARGDDPGGKGDYQGCSEFNPLMIFSQEEQKEFEQAKDKGERNAANAPNRRVMLLIFREGSRVDPSKWPCPRVTEGTAGCKKRFWSDGEKRRSVRLPTERREFDKAKDTFACRFYNRLVASSPCERVRPPQQLLWILTHPQLRERDDITLLVLDEEAREVLRLKPDAPRDGPGLFFTYDFSTLDREKTFDAFLKAGDLVLYTGFRFRPSRLSEALLSSNRRTVLENFFVSGPLGEIPEAVGPVPVGQSDIPYRELPRPPETPVDV